MKEQIYDTVNNPAHYVEGREYEPVKVIRDWGLNFNLGCVVKYIARAGRKEGETDLDDLEKARRYLTYEIRALQGGDMTDDSDSE